MELDKAGRWSELPALPLDMETREALDVAMPGTASFLQRHEWIKHGTCYDGAGPDEYFADSLQIMEALNASQVQTLFAGSVGRHVSGDDIRAAFDASFGAGAGERVRISCKNDGDRRLIVELTIGLSGKIEPGTNAADHILASAPTEPGCPGGIVDPVGNQ